MFDKNEYKTPEIVILELDLGDDISTSTVETGHGETPIRP